MKNFILIACLASAFSTSAFASKINLNDAFTLADVMYCEARDQGKVGMLAVADVVMNRVASKRFPNTVYGVVHQSWQFECIERNVAIDESSKHYEQALSLAIKVLKGKSPRITHADHYHAVWMDSYPNWSKSKQIAKLGVIGEHIFYAYR